MKNILSLVILIFALVSSAQSDQAGISGLWIMEKVQAGDQEMTPNARWVRFNADFTQESGNGWFQHSFGTYVFEDGNLSITNTNGLKDAAGAFKVDLKENKMTWARVEDGMEVTVRLVRAETLPLTYGDKVLGLWQLQEANGESSILPMPESGKEYIFLRWDKKFELGTPEGKKYGVYNVHAHKPELELIPYGDSVERSFWSIEYGEDEIILTLVNSDVPVTRSFKRIKQFPR